MTDVEARVGAITQLMHDTATYVMDRTNEYEWQPYPNSVGEAEQTANPSLTANVISYVGVFATAASDHLHSLADLYGPTTSVLLGGHVMARAATEAAGRLFWLIDPDVTVDVRLERYYQMRVRGLRDSAGVIRSFRLGDTVPPELRRERETSVADVEARLAGALQDAVNAGLKVDRKDGQITGLRSSPEGKLPGDGALAAAVLRKSELRSGAAIYTYLSGIVHSLPWALMDFFKGEIPPGATSGQMQGTLTLSQVEQGAFIGTMAHATMADQMWRWFGWPNEEWTTRKMRIAAVLFANKSL